MNLKDNNTIMISVCMITYNHEKYIGEAIESVIKQKTNFELELVIGEDFSTDNTKNICDEYSRKRPNLIRLLNTEKNLGVIPNFIRTLKACKGKYIAICEGDDFWTDPYKLQKQVDFLETNPEYSLCFHDVAVKWENKSIITAKFCQGLMKENFDIHDIIKGWFIPTASMVFRTKNIIPLPKWFNELSTGDYALQLLCAMHGKVKFINEEMAVYRRTLGSDSMTSRYNTINNISGLIYLFTVFNEHSKHNYSRSIKIRITRLKFERFLLFQKTKFPKTWAFLKKIKNLT